MDPLRLAAGRDPGASALAAGDRRWSYGDLDAWVDRIVLRLHEAGIGPGALVGMVLPPSPEAVALVHAVPRAGGLLLPLHPGWGEEERRRAIAAVGGVAVLVTLPADEWVGEEALAGLAGGFGDSVASPDPDTPLALVMTSGSTGRPRAIPLTRGNLEASARGAIDRLRLDASDRWLASLSPAHVGGLALIHRAAVVGCELVTRPRFEATELANLIDSGRITHASLVPTMLERLLQVWRTDDDAGGGMSARGLRALLIGGAGIPSGVLDRALAARLPIALTYGLTEASSQVATAPPDRVRERWVEHGRGATTSGRDDASHRTIAYGRPLDGVELRIAEPDESGAGEIQVRGPTVAPLAPTEAGVGVGPDGWLRTGDLGRIDEEGELEVVGRLSDRIVTGGVTVEPAEVEALLLRHPSVADVAVVGMPDPGWGERVVAFVVWSGDGASTVEELIEFAAERISPAKRPREVRVVDSLPLNANGKVDRKALRSV